MLDWDDYSLWEETKAGLSVGKMAKGLSAHPPRW